MDNIIDLTSSTEYVANNDISAQTFDLIQKIKNASTPIGSTAVLSEFNSSGTWTLPTIKPKFVYLLMVGGGGSGSAKRTSGYGSSGGGGGGINERLLTDVNGDITVTIGDGGAKPTTDNATGGNGGNTVISYTNTLGETITLTAYGGEGGQGEGTGSGGTGGTGDYNGGNGADGELNNGQAGTLGKYGLGDGGGAGSDFNGNLMPGGAGNSGSLNYPNAKANTGCGGGGAGQNTILAGNGAKGYCKLIYWTN